MYKPCVRETVQVEGRSEVFFVLTVYNEANSADLIALKGAAYIEHNVPFALLKPYDNPRQLWGARRGQNEGMRVVKR